MGDESKSEVGTQTEQLHFMLSEDTAKIVGILRDSFKTVFLFIFQKGNHFEILQIIKVEVFCACLVIFSEFFGGNVKIDSGYLALCKFESYPDSGRCIHVNSFDLLFCDQANGIAIFNFVWGVTCDLSVCQFKVNNVFLNFVRVQQSVITVSRFI